MPKARASGGDAGAAVVGERGRPASGGSAESEWGGARGKNGMDRYFVTIGKVK